MHHKACSIFFGLTAAGMVHLFFNDQYDSKQKELQKSPNGYHQIKFNAVKNVPFFIRKMVKNNKKHTKKKLMITFLNS